MDNGFDCPECGCNDSHVERCADNEARRWKKGALVGVYLRRTETRRCNNCDHRWTSTTQKLLPGPANT